jgi:hypothetical protein
MKDYPSAPYKTEDKIKLCIFESLGFLAERTIKRE